ncbi:hypothetical protein E4U41_006188 [Claviceps citrina]|nr:hypothetical protein E4U41_006188 [Claviceps citrina]
MRFPVYPALPLVSGQKHARDEPVRPLGLSVDKRQAASGETRFAKPNQVGSKLVPRRAAPRSQRRLLNKPQDQQQQLDFDSRTPSPSLILVSDKDKPWNKIGLATGIIVALAACAVLTGVLFLWLLHRRKRNCARGKRGDRRDYSPATQPPSPPLPPSPPPPHPHPQCTHRAALASTLTTASTRHELFVPDTPPYRYPAWQQQQQQQKQPPPYYGFCHEGPSPRPGNSTWMMNQNVISPIDSSDGLSPLSNYHDDQASLSRYTVAELQRGVGRGQALGAVFVGA